MARTNRGEEAHAGGVALKCLLPAFLPEELVAVGTARRSRLSNRIKAEEVSIDSPSFQLQVSKFYIQNSVDIRQHTLPTFS